MPIYQATTYRVYPTEIQRILTKPGGPIGVRIRSICLEIASVAEQTTLLEVGKDPRDKPRTGKMAKAWAVEVEANGQGFAYTVRNKKNYAWPVDEGARPHEIRARKAKYLRFKDRQGRWRVAKVVNHPGNQRPYRILRRSTRAVLSRRLK